MERSAVAGVAKGGGRFDATTMKCCPTLSWFGLSCAQANPTTAAVAARPKTATAGLIAFSFSHGFTSTALFPALQSRAGSLQAKHHDLCARRGDREDR